jgi:thiol-disulfide isomerase/thioredoxin
MSKRQTYNILVIAIFALIGMYLFNKYKVAPKIDVTNLEVVDSTSAKFDIKSLKGKKVIVSFYASWCPDCIKELKALNEIKNEKLKDIEVLAITDETLEKLISFKNKKQYPFTFLKLSKSFNDLKIYSIPTVYLLNKKGEIVFQKVGYINWKDESELLHLTSLMD